ncbi:uncharacterized protein ATC70_009223 [Mucor velutinosus]|uniref:Uncharacterized protein n=1 Tax=Mucor velutinosus TaxID=708070 RepID=A0AAN7DPP4_9FUNG|nr:hypothetical protein ATC70_009223 [Mucor velutinosus]
MSATMLSPRSTLLEETEGDSYFNSKSSYYKRGNLLATSSFRQKYKNGFRRSRSSSYTSLDDEKEQQNNSLLEQTPSVSPPVTTTSFFSRKRLAQRSNTAPIAAINAGPDTQDGDYFNHEDNYVDAPYADDDEDSDENTFFAKQNYYSRQNLSKPTTSWKSSVLKAVGVKSR